MKLDRLAMLAFAQVAPSVPTRGLNVIYNITPLKLFVQQTALNSYVCLEPYLDLDWVRTNKNKCYNISHLRFWDKISREQGLLFHDRDRIKIKNWDRGYAVDRSE